jgi:hypothetical protein
MLDPDAVRRLLEEHLIARAEMIVLNEQGRIISEQIRDTIEEIKRSRDA